jgi:hypothetical protein
MVEQLVDDFYEKFPPAIIPEDSKRLFTTEEIASLFASIYPDVDLQVLSNCLMDKGYTTIQTNEGLRWSVSVA